MGNYTLQTDLLAKGMTKEPKIVGVPFSFALANIALSTFIMIAGYAITHNLLAMVAALGLLLTGHIILMILSLKDDRILSIYIKNSTLCYKAPTQELSSYNALTRKINPTRFSERAVSKHIPWSHLVNERTIMTKKGELMQILALDGYPFYCEEEIDVDLNKDIRNRLLYQMASPELAVYFYTLRRNENVTLQSHYSIDYARAFNNRYQQSFNQKNHYQNRLYLVLLHKAPKFQQGKGAVKKKVSETRMRFYTNALQTLDNQSARLVSLFKQSGCRILAINQEGHAEHLQFLSELVNMQSRPVVAPMQSLANYLPYTSHHFARRKGIVQITAPNGDTKFAAMLSLKEYPEHTHAALLNVLLTVDCELIATQSFYFKHAERAQKELTTQYNKLETNDGSITFANGLLLALEDAKAGIAAYGDHHLSLCVLGDSLEALNKAIYRVESRLNQDAQLITVREEKGVELAFWAQLPGNYRYQIRQSLISSLNMAGFANLHNYPIGNAKNNHWGDALTFLETQAGTPYYFNFHVGQVGNSIFIGPMGSGKTLLLSAFLTLSTKYGGWRYVFDKDRGMELIVRALGGQYNVMLPGNPSGMAPLQLADTAENRAFNCLLLKKLLSSTTPLSVNDEKIIEQAITGAYALPQTARRYRNIAPFFGVSTPGSLRERFDRWHTWGQHAWLFDNESDSFAISNKIAGLDIGNLLKPAYEEVSTPALMYIFHRLGECLDSSPTAVFIPEGWKALSDPLFKAQLTDWSKTPRKNNMAVIMDTQSPTDLAQSAAGRAIAAESVTQVFFANPKAAWEDYRQFNLTAKEFEIIKFDLPTMAGEFYFLLKQGNNSVVARLNLMGLTQDIPVLSGSKAGVLLFDEIAKRTGSAPEQWLPPFVTLTKRLKEHYNNDFTKLLADFDHAWRECHEPH